MNYDPPFLPVKWKDGKVLILDQTLLPGRVSYRVCRNYRQVAECIRKMRVRGAPAIGIAGALGVVLGVWKKPTRNYATFEKELNKLINVFSQTRPTAVNLFWTLKRMRTTAQKFPREKIADIKYALLAEAQEILKEDQQVCQEIGQNGLSLLHDGDTVLTYCNAGGLATSGYGTALAPIFLAREKGLKIKVFVCETRPLLQGARITTWELLQKAIDTYLICDNMAAVVMKEGKIGCVMVGADRIASNGDTANKIGTYGLAILAREHGIPFYVAAPLSTFDYNTTSGDQIPIEQRDNREVLAGLGKEIAPRNVKIFNPAFDVTPAKYITNFITEAGIIAPPFSDNLREMIVNNTKGSHY
jgi:methylthioribose-1-phosphate isomerase